MEELMKKGVGDGMRCRRVLWQQATAAKVGSGSDNSTRRRRQQHQLHQAMATASPAPLPRAGAGNTIGSMRRAIACSSNTTSIAAATNSKTMELGG